MEFCAACMENLANTHEFLKQNLLTGENITFHKWRNFSGSGSCHVSNALEDHEFIAVSLALPCKTQTSRLLRPKMPCKFIWCRNHRHLVAMKTLLRLRMCFAAIYLHNRHQISMPKQLLKS